MPQSVLLRFNEKSVGGLLTTHDHGHGHISSSCLELQRSFCIQEEIRKAEREEEDVQGC